MANISKHIKNIQKKKSKFTIKEIYPKIFHLEFSSRTQLCTAFCRFQEYYESPKFRNKIFTLDEYADWYQKEYDQKVFSYHKDWSGFNIPSNVLKPFYSGKFKNITVQERQILNLFKKMKGKKFYIIGTYTQNNSKKDMLEDIKHELGHGLYYVKTQYKKAIDLILNKHLSLRQRKKFEKYLSGVGYCKEVFQDEIQAYILANRSHLIKNKLHNKKIDLISKKINKVFEEFSGAV